MLSPCPACHQRRRGRGLYLCRLCWVRLPKETRALLWQRDAGAVGRYLRLLRALKDGRMPDDIRAALVA